MLIMHIFVSFLFILLNYPFWVWNNSSADVFSLSLEAFSIDREFVAVGNNSQSSYSRVNI